MKAPAITDAWGFALFAVLGVFACFAIFYKKRAFTTRFVLLFAGTAFMSLLTTKSIAYFIVGGIPAFSYMLKDAVVTLKIDNNQKRDKKDKKKLIILVAAFILMLGVLGAVLALQPADSANIAESSNTAEASDEDDYAALREMVKILDKENKDDVVLYASFNHGQFFEYYDYHPYIDGRAELFLKDNNKEFDYLEEYGSLRSGSLYYKDFVDKYHFTYIATDSTDVFLQASLLHDNDYEIVYKSGKNILFKLKDNK